MAEFAFRDYSVDELEPCGQAFAERFRVPNLADTNPAWTNAVRGWFRNTAAAGVRVYPPSNESSKDEFIVDLCHTTYPLLLELETWPSVPLYERCFERHCQLKLAMECEWGDSRNADRSLCLVLDDACKLAVLRAQLKVMVYSTYYPAEADRTLKALGQLRTCHGDADPWLCLNIVGSSGRTPSPPRDIRRSVMR